jgi:hypothetical protein
MGVRSQYRFSSWTSSSEGLAKRSSAEGFCAQAVAAKIALERRVSESVFFMAGLYQTRV